MYLLWWQCMRVYTVSIETVYPPCIRACRSHCSIQRWIAQALVRAFTNHIRSAVYMCGTLTKYIHLIERRCFPLALSLSPIFLLPSRATEANSYVKRTNQSETKQHNKFEQHIYTQTLIYKRISFIAIRSTVLVCDSTTCSKSGSLKHRAGFTMLSFVAWNIFWAISWIYYALKSK